MDVSFKFELEISSYQHL